MPNLESSTSPVEPLHVIPGRARFRVAGLHHSPASKLAIERELALRHQIKRVSANPLTGTVVVEFDKQIDPTRIRALLSEIVDVGAHHTPSSASPVHSPAAETYRSSLQPVNLSSSVWAGNFTNSGQNGWHHRDVRTITADLGSSEQGLPEQAATDRLAVCGPNRLPELEAPSGWSILFDQFDRDISLIRTHMRNSFLAIMLRAGTGRSH